MKKRLAALLFLAALLLPVSAHAEDNAVVGTVQEVEGTATVAGAPAAVGTPVHAHDALETGPDARLFVLLIDDTELTLSQNAKMKVDEYVFDDTDTADNKARYTVLQGAFLYASGLIAHKDNPDVEVSTPGGTIGIRGTKFWGGDIDKAYGILVTEGQVSVRNWGGAQVVDAGQGVELRDGLRGAPEKPHAWKQPKIDRAVATVTLKDPGLAARIAAMRGRQLEMRAKYRAFIKKHRPHGHKRGG